jgi:hypothetical protein
VLGFLTSGNPYWNEIIVPVFKDGFVTQSDEPLEVQIAESYEWIPESSVRDVEVRRLEITAWGARKRTVLARARFDPRAAGVGVIRAAGWPLEWEIVAYKAPENRLLLIDHQGQCRLHLDLTAGRTLSVRDASLLDVVQNENSFLEEDVSRLEADLHEIRDRIERAGETTEEATSRVSALIGLGSDAVLAAAMRDGPPAATYVARRLVLAGGQTMFPAAYRALSD